MWPGLEGSFQTLIYGLAGIPLGERDVLSVVKASSQRPHKPLYLAEWNGHAIYGAIYGNPMSRRDSASQSYNGNHTIAYSDASAMWGKINIPAGYS